MSREYSPLPPPSPAPAPTLRRCLLHKRGSERPTQRLALSVCHSVSYSSTFFLDCFHIPQASVAGIHWQVSESRFTISAKRKTRQTRWSSRGKEDETKPRTTQLHVHVHVEPSEREDTRDVGRPLGSPHDASALIAPDRLIWSVTPTPTPATTRTPTRTKMPTRTKEGPEIGTGEQIKPALGAPVHCTAEEQKTREREAGSGF